MSISTPESRHGAQQKAWEADMRQSMESLRSAETLYDVMFTTPKELRHAAEQTLGRLFVPMEVVRAGPNAADVVLRPEGLGEIHVHAERERHWYPYHITRIDNIAR